jgi:hypothetical protein
MSCFRLTPNDYAVAEASIRIALSGNKIDENGIVADPTLSLALHSAIITLARVIDDTGYV